MARDAEFLRGFDEWTDAFAAHVGAKGQVPPGKYRAYGFERPGHRWADVKLWWRDRRMRLGHAPEGSSPREQDEEGLNQDSRVHPQRGEGENLRD
jgi:hypothetical protein